MNSPNDNLKERKQEQMRQQIESSVMQAYARTEQELAIARRIDNVETVEIEEYYDFSDQDSLGVDVKEQEVSLWLNMDGRRVSKRIYKFKGWKTIEQKFGNSKKG
jgi:hypothetical protein